MTKDEAEAALFLIDALRERGARQIVVGEVTVAFDPAAAPQAETTKKPSRTKKLGLGFYGKDDK